MLNRIHHINFLVRDLEQAVSRYESLFGFPVSFREELPARSVKIARFKLGGTWIVLVQPTDSESVPGRHLQQYGEGFFLISYQVDDVRQAAARAELAGISVMDSEPRKGVEDWQVIDLDADDLFGVFSQLTESAKDRVGERGPA